MKVRCRKAASEAWNLFSPSSGIMRMSRGQKALLTISPNLVRILLFLMPFCNFLYSLLTKAYGANGSPPNIPSHAWLQFEIELLDILPV